MESVPSAAPVDDAASEGKIEKLDQKKCWQPNDFGSLPKLTCSKLYAISMRLGCGSAFTGQRA